MFSLLPYLMNLKSYWKKFFLLQESLVSFSLYKDQEQYKKSYMQNVVMLKIIKCCQKHFGVPYSEFKQSIYLVDAYNQKSLLLSRIKDQFTTDFFLFFLLLYSIKDIISYIFFIHAIQIFIFVMPYQHFSYFKETFMYRVDIKYLTIVHSCLFVFWFFFLVLICLRALCTCQ